MKALTMVHLVDINSNSQLPFFSIEDSDLQSSLKPSTPRHRHFSSLLHGNFIYKCTMRELGISRRRVKIPGSAPFPLQLLPSELVYKIFEYVHPIDLYNSARTSRVLRGLLLSPYGKTIWKTVLARHPDVILNPTDLLAHEWIILLYGPDECHNCGGQGTVFHCSFRHRACEACQGRHDYYVPRVDYALTPPGLASVVQTLVPTSAFYRFKPYLRTYEQCCISDIRYMASRVTKLIEAKEENPGATAIYDEFLTSESTRVRAIEEHTDRYNIWVERIYRLLTWELSDETAYKRMEKLASLNYDERDLRSTKESIERLIECSYVSHFSRRSWKSIRPDLEFIVKKAATERIQKERKEIVAIMFHDFQKRMPAEAWITAPKLSDIFEFKIFHQYIHSPNLKLEILRFENTAEVFNDVLGSWRKRKQRQFATLIHSHRSNISDLEIAKVLDLATSVFTGSASSSPILFGWKDAGALDHSYIDFSFSKVGYEAAASIVRLLGLESDTTRASDLDNLDARFFCESCHLMRDKRSHGRKAYTWRECVIHAIEMKADSSHIPTHWALLTPDATASVRTFERPILPPSTLSWSCNHCAVHYMNFTKRKAAMNHVIESHSILHPVPGRDIVFMTQPNVLRAAFSLGQDNNYRCKHCLPSKKRLLPMQRLCYHLLNKHGVQQPVENENWVYVKIVEKTSPPQA